jgi:hypothetical protein
MANVTTKDYLPCPLSKLLKVKDCFILTDKRKSVEVSNKKEKK